MVRPGWLEARASAFWPVSALIRLDLPDVAAAGEGDLGADRVGELVEALGGVEEFALAGEEDAGLLEFKLAFFGQSAPGMRAPRSRRTHAGLTLLVLVRLCER